MNVIFHITSGQLLLKIGSKSRTRISFLKKLFSLLQRKPFKIDEQRFLFHLKSSFRSQDIQVFVLTFWSYRKNGLIRKTRLISKYMTSQSDYQTISINILPSISWNKGNQTMKFGQLIEYNKGYIFLQKSCWKWDRETSSTPLFVFLKSFI